MAADNIYKMYIYKDTKEKHLLPQSLSHNAQDYELLSAAQTFL